MGCFFMGLFGDLVVWKGEERRGVLHMILINKIKLPASFIYSNPHLTLGLSEHSVISRKVS